MLAQEAPDDESEHTNYDYLYEKEEDKVVEQTKDERAAADRAEILQKTEELRKKMTKAQQEQKEAREKRLVQRAIDSEKEVVISSKQIEAKMRRAEEVKRLHRSPYIKKL